MGHLQNMHVPCRTPPATAEHVPQSLQNMAHHLRTRSFTAEHAPPLKNTCVLLLGGHASPSARAKAGSTFPVRNPTLPSLWGVVRDSQETTTGDTQLCWDRFAIQRIRGTPDVGIWVWVRPSTFVLRERPYNPDYSTDVALNTIWFRKNDSVVC